MFDLGISPEHLNHICKTHLEDLRHTAEQENQIPHVSWRHRMACTLLVWARKLEPELQTSQRVTV
jgi:hypothetical protein